MKTYNGIVYETSVEEINKLNELTIEQIRSEPLLLKVSQLKNSHVLAIIKQQEVDYKNKDLSLRTTMYELRDERNKVMKEHIILQEKKVNEKNMDGR